MSDEYQMRQFFSLKEKTVTLTELYVSMCNDIIVNADNSDLYTQGVDEYNDTIISKSFGGKKQ